MTSISLKLVDVMPKNLESGVLYVSLEFKTSAHLCPCGCGEKVRTPLTPTEWKFVNGKRGPSLYPSIGNWQKPCRSHYWILEGKIIWAEDWTEEQILAGRNSERLARKQYYDQGRKPQSSSFGNLIKHLYSKLMDWFK